MAGRRRRRRVITERYGGGMARRSPSPLFRRKASMRGAASPPASGSVPRERTSPLLSDPGTGAMGKPRCRNPLAGSRCSTLRGLTSGAVEDARPQPTA